MAAELNLFLVCISHIFPPCFTDLLNFLVGVNCMLDLTVQVALTFLLLVENQV
jgi:hypothetical protein